jgi:hypothetical protein
MAVDKHLDLGAITEVLIDGTWIPVHRGSVTRVTFDLDEAGPTPGIAFNSGPIEPAVTELVAVPVSAVGAVKIVYDEISPSGT